MLRGIRNNVNDNAVPDFTQLADVYRLARETSVSFDLHYDEGDDSWYFTAREDAGAQGMKKVFDGRNHSFDIAVECVTEYLQGLL